MNWLRGLAVDLISPACPLERASSLLSSYRIAGMFLLQRVPEMSAMTGRLSLPRSGGWERGVISWSWDLGSVAGYSFCPLPVSWVTTFSAFQRLFVEPPPSTLTLPVRSLMPRLELQHRTVTRYQRVLSQERSGELTE